MGAGTSTIAIHGRIDCILPHHTFELATTNKERDSLTHNLAALFPGGPHDRAQFVHSLRVLLSSNGQVPLGDKRFKLVFTRPPQESSAADDSNPQVFVSVVAISPDGVLASKIVSERAGVDKVEAFQMLKKTVEMHMHQMLDSVPGPSGHAGPSTAAPMSDPERNASAATLASTVLPDEPPSYQEASK